MGGKGSGTGEPFWFRCPKLRRQSRIGRSYLGGTGTRREAQRGRSGHDRRHPGEENMNEKHCPTCICGRRAPVQAQRDPDRGTKGAGTITWAEYLEAYADYSAKYGRSQSAERLAERHGFGYWELTDHLGHEPKTWEPRR